MKIRTVVLILGIAGLAFYFWPSTPPAIDPPTMQPDGSTTDAGPIITTRTIDYVAILSSALSQKSRFLTLTLAENVVRDREIEVTVLGVPSRARVRVNYHAEYPIGYVLEAGSYSVAKDGKSLVVTLHRPELVATPAVKLKSYKVVDGGWLVDEKTALLKLQQLIQPEAERRAVFILKRPDVVPRSEKAFRAFLEPLLATAAEGGTAPTIKFAYR